jgi:hypothetical protein
MQKWPKNRRVQAVTAHFEVIFDAADATQSVIQQAV